MANPILDPAFDALFGRDLWFDVSLPTAPDLVVTPAGDWKLAEGRDALRQSLIRRIITNPGEWQTLPEFGAGVRLFVKAKDTPAMRQELEEKIRGQLMRDDRVASVDQVVIERLANDGAGLQIFVQVTPRGDSLRAVPLVASVEVT